MKILYANNAGSVLASDITDEDLTLTVDADTGPLFPNPGVNECFYVTLTNESNEREIVKVTSRSGDVFTIERAQESTIAKEYLTGDKIELLVTAGIIADLRDNSVRVDSLVNEESTGTAIYPVMTDLTGAYTSTNKLKFFPNTGRLSSTEFASLSDLKYKYDVKNYNIEMELIDKIRPVSFKWKLDNESSLGFIAQEIESVFPDIVKEDNQGTKYIQYDAMIPILFSAIKNIEKRLKDVENKIVGV